jgi:hypothetical protein
MTGLWKSALLMSWLFAGILFAGLSSAAPQATQFSGEAETSHLKSQPTKKNLPGKHSDGSYSWSLEEYQGTSPLYLLKEIPVDQKNIWTSPFQLHSVDADWFVPLGIATGSMLATDSEFSKNLSNSQTRLYNSSLVSKYGLSSLGGIAGGMYVWGQLTHDDHKKETGLLAGDAALQSFIVARGLNTVLGRDNPLQDNYRGQFFQAGHSFPSQNAAVAWSLASVITHEYPGPVTKLIAYALASAVTSGSISSKQHFPSDVLIGSAIGWFVGEQIYRRHHDPTLGGGEWQTYQESHLPELGNRKRSVGSPYVPLDSWVYPALERLAALGYIGDAFLDMRPWTRIECANMVEQSGERMESRLPPTEDLLNLQLVLASEFSQDLDELTDGGKPSFHMESLYTGFTQVSGQPLNDGYHFGQTLINNFGRPYQQGFNSVSGFSSYAIEDRFAFYFRGEVQHSPSTPGYSEPVRTFISNVDGTSLIPAGPIPAVNQFKLLDAYVAANLANWNLSFGNQSLWWGPAHGSALLFSNNAAPVLMFRANNISPFQLPWIFRHLGPTKLDVFFGRLAGNNQVPERPLIHGEKISFMPTRNLTLGFSRTVEMGGVGRPLTAGHLWLSYFSFTSPTNETPDTDPGKRTGGFDFSYRLPFLRNWLTLYSDSLADDDPSPLAAPRRAAINPGIYLTHFPKISKFDLRVEGVNTNTPSSSNGGHYVYWDSFYRTLYTNNGNLIGSWIGRQGQSVQAWSTYHFGARDTIQVGYRHAKVACEFIPGGETVNDEFMNVDWWWRKNLQFSGFLQHEQWTAPILAARPQTNWTSALQLQFWPRRFFSRGMQRMAANVPLSSSEAQQ